MNVYRTPDERFQRLPGYSFEPDFVEQDGLRMHYVDEGRGNPVLLLRGEPTWSLSSIPVQTLAAGPFPAGG